MVHVMVFRDNTVKSNMGTTRYKILKYHEAVNMAIVYAISRFFGGAHTPRFVHVDNRDWGFLQDTK